MSKGSKLIVENCEISGGSKNFNEGVFASNASDVKLNGSTITSNRGGGVTFSDVARFEMSNCKIIDNNESDATVDGESNGIFRNNQLSRKGHPGYWRIDSPAKVTRIDNTPNE